MASTWSPISAGNPIENQPPALLSGMGITANCLLHNYLPKMKDLVILVSDSPNVQRPITASARLAGVPAKAVSDSYSEALAQLGGEGRASQGQRPQSDLSSQFAN